MGEISVEFDGQIEVENPTKKQTEIKVNYLYKNVLISLSKMTDESESFSFLK